MSKSDSFPNSVSASQGAVSAEYVIFLPFLLGPTIPSFSGSIFFPFNSMISPICNFFHSLLSGIPKFLAF